MNGGGFGVRQSLPLLYRAMRTVLPLFVLAASFAGCRSSAPAIGSRAASSPAERIEMLRAVRGEPGSMISLAKVTVSSPGQTRSFSSRIETDFARLRMSVYSPIGTEVATVFLSGHDAIVLDHQANTYWRGSPGELATLPAAAAIAKLSPELASAVLFGVLPADAVSPCSPVAGQACVASEEGSWFVSAAGVVSARVGDVSASYDSPQFPPARVTVRSGATSLVVRHGEVVRTGEPVAAPEIPSSYRRSPSLAANS